ATRGGPDRLARRGAAETPLCGPPVRGEDAADPAREPPLLAAGERRDWGRTRNRTGSGRTWHHRRAGRGLPQRRPDPPAGAGPAAGHRPQALAARRAIGRARRRGGAAGGPAHWPEAGDRRRRHRRDPRRHRGRDRNAAVGGHMSTIIARLPGFLRPSGEVSGAWANGPGEARWGEPAARTASPPTPALLSSLRSLSAPPSPRGGGKPSADVPA